MFEEKSNQPEINLSSITTRYLPVRRHREHVDALRRDGRFGIVPNFVFRSDLSKSELAVLLHLLLLGDKQHPTKAEIAKACGLRPQQARKALKNLCAKNILKEEKVALSPINYKSIWHITDPVFWKITAGQSFDLSSKPSDTDRQHGPLPAIAKTPKRQNDCDSFLKDFGGYVEIPRLISSIELPYCGKLIWCYLASLVEFEHPTVRQISKDLGLAFGTVRKHMAILVDKRMIAISKGHRFAGGLVKMEQLYHTVDVALWDFEQAKVYTKPLGSILYDIDFNEQFARNQNGPSRGIKTDPHEESKRTLTRNQNGPSEESKRTLGGIKTDPQANPQSHEPQGLEPRHFSYETVPYENVPYDNPGKISEQGSGGQNDNSSSKKKKITKERLLGAIKTVFLATEGREASVYLRDSLLDDFDSEVVLAAAEAMRRKYPKRIVHSADTLRAWKRLCEEIKEGGNFVDSLDKKDAPREKKNTKEAKKNGNSQEDIQKAIALVKGQKEQRELIVQDTLWNCRAGFGLPEKSDIGSFLEEKMLAGELCAKGFAEMFGRLAELRNSASSSSSIPF